MLAPVIRKRLNAALPNKTIGCALQEASAVAVCARGGARGWSIDWAADGALGDKRFLHALSCRAWLRDFWVTPTRGGSAQKDFAFAIETPDPDVTSLSGKTKSLLLKTQVEQRYPVVIEPVVLAGEEVQGPDGICFVGGGSIKLRIEDDVKMWRRLVGARRPHIASAAAALANVYMALYPGDVRDSRPQRMVVAEGEVVTAVVMDSWKLVDSVEYQMLEGQKLTRALIDQWIDFMRANHTAGELDPEPLVVGIGDHTEATDLLEIWNPFESKQVRVKPAAAQTLSRRAGVAAVALGMAMQGGD